MRTIKKEGRNSALNLRLRKPTRGDWIAGPLQHFGQGVPRQWGTEESGAPAGSHLPSKQRMAGATPASLNEDQHRRNGSSYLALCKWEKNESFPQLGPARRSGETPQNS